MHGGNRNSKGAGKQVMADLSSFMGSLRGASVLGINPPVQDFTFFDLWAKPLGLLFILDFLRGLGNTVSLLDCVSEGETGDLSFGRRKVCRTEIPRPRPYRDIPRRYWQFGMDDGRILSRLAAMPRPDFVFVTSGMTYWYGGVFRCIEMVRSVFPSCPVFLGGIYARLCPEHALLSGADAVQTAPLSLKFSRPAMDLYPRPGYAVLLTSFGCPLFCEYCASRLLFPQYAQRDAREFLSDARFQLSLPGMSHGAFYDDALLVDKENRFYPFCRTLARDFPDVRFHTPNGLHVREIDGKCAHILRQTGFSTIRLSLESTDPDFQRRGTNKTSREEYVHALRNLMEAGYSGSEVETYILAGVPGQKRGTAASSLEFVKSLGARPRLAEYSPVPGTVSFGEAANLVPDLSREPLLQNKTVYASYISGSIPPEELQKLKDISRA